MADLTKINLNGTDYNLKDSNAIKGVQVNGVDLTIDSNKKVNIVNDYLMRTTVIDCTSLDQDSWYPVTFTLSFVYPTIIEIHARDYVSGLSWSTHSDRLYSVHKKIVTLGSKYGGNNISEYPKIYESNYAWTRIDPVQKFGQVIQVSLCYVYVRGGGRYNFRLSNNTVPVLRTTNYTVGSGTSYETTLSVLTSAPNELIKVNIAKTSDIPTKLSQLTDDVVSGKYLPAVPDDNITSVNTLDYNRRGCFKVPASSNSRYYEIGKGMVSMIGNCRFHAYLRVTVLSTDNQQCVYDLEISCSGSGNQYYTAFTPVMYIREPIHSTEKIFEFYFKDTRTNDTLHAARNFEWILYYRPLSSNTTVYTEMIECSYGDFGTSYDNSRTQNTYSLWKGSAYPNPTRQDPQTLVTGYTLAADRTLLSVNKLGDTMLGDLNMGSYSVVLRSYTSWDNVDRSIPFSLPNYPAKIALYKDDFTYNPNTGALKAGSFVKKGGTASQFLKADGSVDSNTYLTQHYITGITSGAANSTENSSVVNPYINISDSSIHRGQVQLKGGGDITISSSIGTLGGIITISGANTKVTSVNNHYAPVTNSASSLPTSMAQNVYIKQILRDAKGHVTGVNTEELSFSAYGVKVVIPQARMYNYSNGLLITKGVKEFLQSIANECINNSYEKFCNGFILNVKDTSDNTLDYIYFRSSTDGRGIAVSTTKPIYFNFLCDNPKGFIEGSSDAFAVIYAYVVDGTPLSNPMNRYVQIMLWYTSEGAVEGYTVYDNGFYNEGMTRNTTVITSRTAQMDDAILEGWKNNTAITLNISALDEPSVTLNVGKYGFTSLKKVRIVAPRDVMEGKGTLTLTIYNRVVVLDSSYSVANITVAYDEKGNVMDVSIN